MRRARTLEFSVVRAFGFRCLEVRVEAFVIFPNFTSTPSPKFLRLETKHIQPELQTLVEDGFLSSLASFNVPKIFMAVASAS